MPDSYLLYHKLRFIAKLSGKKLLNAARLRLAHLNSRISHKARYSGMPASMSVEVSRQCKLNCPECDRAHTADTNSKPHMDMALYQKRIDQAAPYLLNLNLYFLGEPYMNPRFHEMVAYANKKGIYTQSSTNGQGLDEEAARQTVLSRLDKLIISIDGASQESYAKTRRGGQLPVVLENMKRLSLTRKKLKKKTPYIQMQCLVHRHNEHELADIKKMGRAHGADRVVFKSMQLHHYENGHPLMTGIEKYNRYRKGADGHYHIKSHLPKRCLRLWEACVVDYRGHVLPCCYDKHGQYTYGENGDESLHTIMHSQKAQAFRQRLITDRESIGICRNCTSGLRLRH